MSPSDKVVRIFWNLEYSSLVLNGDVCRKQERLSPCLNMTILLPPTNYVCKKAFLFLKWCTYITYVLLLLALCIWLKKKKQLQRSCTIFPLFPTSFYADFGPLNLAMVYRYCCKLNKKLKVTLGFFIQYSWLFKEQKQMGFFVQVLFWVPNRAKFWI